MYVAIPQIFAYAVEQCTCARGGRRTRSAIQLSLALTRVPKKQIKTVDQQSDEK